MSTQLAVVGARELLNEKDIEILKNSKFRNFEPHEIDYASKICTQLQLSPFLNQIHFVKRKNKDGTYSIASQVGIDGFRLAALRAGGYAGSDEPMYETKPGLDRPVKASVTVYRIVDGIKCSFTASARWDEYCPAPPNDAMWRKMPFNQLAKCAEALALRKGFPADLSSIYTDEEMAQADRPDKAGALNSALHKKEPKDVESEVVGAEESAQPNDDSACPSCNGAMMVSKFANRQTGAFDWYCSKCKVSKPRGA